MRRRPLEFETDDHVFVRVTPTTGVEKEIKSNKLTLKFLGPYQILRHVGPMAYEMVLLPFLANLHNIFHVSQLRKYIPDPTHVLEVDIVQMCEDLTYKTQLARTEDQRIKQLRGKTISLVKVIWSDNTGGMTWKLEDKMCEQYPRLFPNQ
ncbi:uncharacterized protein LOC114381721 [Glycine soja]|uniref:uncharacterized protein LOC114381721 n=1 Tax=Glycine soja TaxID=3848 RepID=UPI00103A564C|nr:uncharacterized protein LOC114381721 [Glycine soja]